MRLKHSVWIWILTGAILLSLAGDGHAVAPFGPPRAVVGAGGFALGGEYLMQDTQMESFGLYQEGYVDGTIWYCKYERLNIEDAKVHAGFMKISYGLGDSWDVFARVGMTSSEGTAKVPWFQSHGVPATDFFQPGTTFDLDNGFDLAWGVGTCMTFSETGDLAFGTIVQFTWFEPKAADVSFTDPQDQTVSIGGQADLSYWEIQLALGATLNLGAIWLYGGPFLHFAKGTLTMDGWWEEEGYSNREPIRLDHDIRDKSNLGFFGGLHWSAADNVGFYVEGLYIGDSWGLGAGGMIRLR